MKGLFVTGTDTGVGKTWVTAALVTYLNRPGFVVGAMKPFETGIEDRPKLPNGDGLTDDEILRTVTEAYAKQPYSIAEARPFSFKLPAAQFEGKQVDF